MNNSEKLFLEELLDLVRILEDIEDSSVLLDKLETIKRRYNEVPLKNSLWTILDDMCGDITDTYFILLEYLYAAVKDEEVIKKQLQILKKGVQEDKIDLFYAIFYKWQMIHRIFMSFESKSLYIERNDLHIEMLKKMKQFLQVDFPPIKEECRDRNRVVVTITQFLGVKHGPTRNALDYCYNLQKNFNKDVFLFVAAEMPPDESNEYECFGLNYNYFNYCDCYNGYFYTEYLGEKIYGYQCRIVKDNKKEISGILQKIYEWKPYLIYNIGSENLAIDICGSFTTEISVPCANDFPISEAQYHILTRTIEDRDKEIVDYIHARNQKVIESIFVYKLQEPLKKYKKSEFGIDENAFVIAIVGTRLGREINTKFIPTLQAILELDPSVQIVFMGSFKNYEEKLEIIGYGDRVKYLGHQDDLRGALNIADLYLNPIRKGGGTSGAEALAEGIPVITLGQCDVAYTCGGEFLCSSLEEMPQLVKKYMTDIEFYDSQTKKAKLQAERVGNTEEVLRDIFHQVFPPASDTAERFID